MSGRVEANRHFSQRGCSHANRFFLAEIWGHSSVERICGATSESQLFFRRYCVCDYCRDPTPDGDEARGTADRSVPRSDLSGRTQSQYRKPDEGYDGLHLSLQEPRLSSRRASRGAARTFFSRLSGSNPRELFPRITVSIQPPASIVMPKGGNGRMRRRKAGEGMRKIMQEMIFRSRPDQTLYTALIDAMDIYGRGRKMVEDMRQTEFSYNALLKMTLVLGLLVKRVSGRGETVGILMPNLAATLCIDRYADSPRNGDAQLHGGTTEARVPASPRFSTHWDVGKIRDTARLQAQVDALRTQVVYLKLQPPSISRSSLGRCPSVHRLLGRARSRSPAACYTYGSEGVPKV